MEPKLVKVPTEADIQKALGTASKGISEATHKAHLGLWQGYANKTNEIRKALAELDTDPAKGNQIYSQTRALKVNYGFAYGGYINHNVYFDVIGGDGGPATGDVATLITEAYGSFEKWAADLKSTGHFRSRLGLPRLRSRRAACVQLHRRRTRHLSSLE